MYDVITIGTATRDVFVKSAAFDVHEAAHAGSGIEGCFPLGAKIELDELIFETGGGATNAAVTFGRLGWRAATVAAVGDDTNGQAIAAVLRSEKVTASFMQTVAGKKTASSIIVVAGSGERTVLVYRGAAEAVAGHRVPWSKLKTKWFYISSLGGNLDLVRSVIAFAERTGAKVAWNPGAKELAKGLKALAPFIHKIDILLLNKEEAAHLIGAEPSELDEIIHTLRHLPRRAAIITDGNKGAYAADGKEALHCGIIDVPRVNATGAGDAFGSGLIAGLLKRDDLRYALAVGIWNATGVVQQMGAKRGILKKYPSPAQVRQVVITQRP